MNTPKIIIAIDGHSSTGKSSFAKVIAARLNLIFIDTGALYRELLCLQYVMASLITQVISILINSP